MEKIRQLKLPLALDKAERLTRAQIKSLISFQDGDFFELDGYEHLRQMTWVEAIEAMLDESILSHSGDALGYLLEEKVFLTIVAYKRQEISNQERQRWSEWLSEMLRERFSEDYSNEDGDDGLSCDHDKELKLKLLEVVDWYTNKARVYPCARLRGWTFDSEDLAELVRVFRPEWLQAANDLPKTGNQTDSE